MIDHVISALPSGRVALHAAWIGSGAATAADLGCSREPALRPVGPDLNEMTAALERIAGPLRHAIFDHQHPGARGARPERDWEVLGMPCGRVNRFLQIHPGVNVPQEKLRGPLILLISARRTPCKVRLAVAQCHGRAQRGARALARRQRGRMILLQPEHLRAAAKAEAKLRNDGRRLKPTAGGRRRDHVAGVIDDIEMYGVAAYLAETTNGGLAGTHRAYRFPVTFLPAQFYDRPEALH